MRVYSLTLSRTPRSMRHDSWALLLAYNFATPCLGRKPKARVATSNPFPIIIAHFNAFKVSLSTSLPSPKLSLLSRNTRSGLDASGLMYIGSIIL